MASIEKRKRDLVELVTAFLKARDVTEFFDAVLNRLPILVPFDHANLLIVHPATATYTRKLSPGFPEQIFDDYARAGAQADLILQRGMQQKAGSIIHFGTVRNDPAAPNGWERLVEVTTAAGCVDTITTVLLISAAEGWGAALTLWRFTVPGGKSLAEGTFPSARKVLGEWPRKSRTIGAPRGNDSRPFSAEEVQSVQELGPLLAGAFDSVWTTKFLRANYELITSVAANAGYFSFLAREDGVPIHVAPVFEKGIRAICGTIPKDTIPAAVRKAAKKLIADHRPEDDHTGPIEVVIRDHRCRVFVTSAPSPLAPAERGIYRVSLLCTPIYVNMSPLTLVGFLPNEVKVLELLQRGKDIYEISKALSLKLNTTRYYLRAVRKKFRAKGKAETVAKAIAQCREIGIMRALLGSHAKLPIADARGRSGRPRVGKRKYPPAK